MIVGKPATKSSSPSLLSSSYSSSSLSSSYSSSSL
jgi:hypothetical protein